MPAAPQSYDPTVIISQMGKLGAWGERLVGEAKGHQQTHEGMISSGAWNDNNATGPVRQALSDVVTALTKFNVTIQSVKKTGTTVAQGAQQLGNSVKL
jgi:hypothetical protein